MLMYINAFLFLSGMDAAMEIYLRALIKSSKLMHNSQNSLFIPMMPKISFQKKGILLQTAVLVQCYFNTQLRFEIIQMQI
jgi:hypothetical protein